MEFDLLSFKLNLEKIFVKHEMLTIVEFLQPFNYQEWFNLSI
jgi:hypothetical protein